MPTNSTHARKRLYINPDIQGALILRTIAHWMLYMAALLMTVALWTLYRSEGAPAIAILQEVFSNFAPAFIAGLVLLPVFLFDQLKFSNRMVGPIYRIRGEMRKLIRGEGVQKLRFRDRDHWPELAEEFNHLAEVVIRTRRTLRKTEEKCEEISNSSSLAKVRRRHLERHEVKLHRR